MSAANCNDPMDKLMQASLDKLNTALEGVLPTTVAEARDLYLKISVPSNAPEIQKRETSRAFYSGAAFMIDRVLKLGNTMDEEQAGKALKALHQEIADHYAKVLEGIRSKVEAAGKAQQAQAAASVSDDWMNHNPFKH